MASPRNIVAPNDGAENRHNVVRTAFLLAKRKVSFAFGLLAHGQ